MIFDINCTIRSKLWTWDIVMPKWWHLEQYNNETGYNVIYNFYHHKNTFFCCISLPDEVF